MCNLVISIFKKKGSLTEHSYIDTNSNGSYDSGETAAWNAPLYLSPAGGQEGSLDGVESYNVFWSPIATTVSFAYNMYLYSNGGMGPGTDYIHRYNGYSVRCVARPVPSMITFSGSGSGVK